MPWQAGAAPAQQETATHSPGPVAPSVRPRGPTGTSSPLAEQIAHVVPGSVARPSGRAEAQADAVADAVLRLPTGGAAASPVPDAGVTRPSPSPARLPGGSSLGPLRSPAEAVTGVDLGDVRVHDAPHLTQALGARAATRGGDILVGRGSTDRVLAHEAAHVAQQSAGARTMVQRWSDPTITSLGPEEVETWSAAELTTGFELLLDQIAPVNMSVSVGSVEASYANLHLIVATAIRKRVVLRDDLLARIPALYGPPAGVLTDVLALVDLLEAMVRREFPAAAVPVVARLEQYRKLYYWLDAGALGQACTDVIAAVSAVGTATRIQRVATDPGGDAALTAATMTLQTALANLLGGLLTADLDQLVAKAGLARDAWLGELTESFRRTALGARDYIATTIVPSSYGRFSTGMRAWGTDALISEPARDVIVALEQIRAIAFKGLTTLAGEVPVGAEPLETRVGFVATNTVRLDELLALVERITLGVALCDQGREFAELVWHEYQINSANAVGLATVSRALWDLVTTDYTRANLPVLRRKVQAALGVGVARIQSIIDYQTKVTWFINIAATLLGIGAMRAVMALPAIANLGRTGATIVGSLAFTTTRVVLTGNQGRPLTAGGFLADAAKDYFLLRLLGGADARIVARVGETGILAAAARLGGVYGTLVGWTLLWNALEPGTPGPTGSHTASTGDVLVQTGVDLAVLMIAEALLRAPVIPPADTALAGRDPGAGRQARQQWQALRSELEAAGHRLRGWLGGSRKDAATGDGLLVRVAGLFGRTKGLHARFQELGEIDSAQRAQLDAHADAMLESIRNARDEVRLDVRNVTPETLSYRGSPENLSAYLERLVTQGRAKEVADEGGGVYSVRGGEGTLYWFFPEGRQSPVVIDLVAESVEASAPNVPQAVRSQALMHLRAAGWGDLGTFAGGLPRGRGGPFIEWVAGPDVGAVLADGGLPMPVVRQLALGPAPQLEPVAAADPRMLPVWYRAWADGHPKGRPEEFTVALADLAEWRGTLDVGGPFAATSLLGRRAAAERPTEIVFPAPRLPSAGLTIGATPTSGPVAAALRGEVVVGARYLQTTRHGATIVIEIVRGRVARMIEVAADGTITRRIPVAAHMATLREILIKVGGLQDAAARTELGRADPLLAELDPLLDFHDGVPAEQVHLIAALADYPLRSTAAAPTLPPDPRVPRAPRRIVVPAGKPPSTAGPAISLDDPSPLVRRRNEPESAFVDRVVRSEERAYQESINGPAGGGLENPARWARVQPPFSRLIGAMRRMQARLQRSGRGGLLPQVNEEVLNQPLDLFIRRNPVLRQMRLEIDARLREWAAGARRNVSESPEWKTLQEFLNGKSGAGAKDDMGRMQPDIVEFMLDDGSIHISDVTIQELDPLSVHAFKTRVYVEIMRGIVGPEGPRVSGQDVQMRTDQTGQRIDPARTRFGDILE